MRERARERLAAYLESLGLEPSAPSPCPYLPGRASRLLLLRPRHLTPGLYHLLLDLNFRRLGWGVYRPECEGCSECRQLRLPAGAFEPTRSQRRCWRRNADVTATLRPPEATPEKHAVYRRYLETRHNGEMTGAWDEFESFLHEAPPFTKEVVFRLGERFLGAGIVDVEPEAVSAVYFYFDPDLSDRSPGTFNVLWLLEECQRRGIPWLYLGYHVAGGRGMAYKTDFHPHQILGEDGGWLPESPSVPFEAKGRPMGTGDGCRIVPMKLQPEQARPHDVADGLDLLRRVELSEKDVAERWGHYFVVREDDGRVVGMAGLEVHGEDGLLRSVAVDEDYRGQGLGTALVEAALERAAKLGLGTVYLLTIDARDYFAGMGFAECPREEASPAIGASWEFTTGCPATAAFMRRAVRRG